jgi:hypothetical protein
MDRNAGKLYMREIAYEAFEEKSAVSLRRLRSDSAVEMLGTFLRAHRYVSGQPALSPMGYQGVCTETGWPRTCKCPAPLQARALRARLPPLATPAAHAASRRYAPAFPSQCPAISRQSISPATSLAEISSALADSDRRGRRDRPMVGSERNRHEPQNRISLRHRHPRHLHRLRDRRDRSSLFRAERRDGLTAWRRWRRVQLVLSQASTTSDDNARRSASTMLR